MSRTQTRHQVRHLANFTTDPNKAGEKMLEAIKSLEKVTRRQRALNLIQGLVIKKVGTHSIEKAAKLVTGEEERDENVVTKLMKIAELKSREKLVTARSVMQRSTKEAVQLLPAGWMRKKFLSIRAGAAQELWEDGRAKNKTKEDHLEARVKPRKEQRFVEGIPVGDEELDEEATENVEIEVKTYGVEVNEAEKEYLRVPNSMTDFKKLDVEQALTCVQVTAAKLRMSFRESGDSQGMDSQHLQEEIKSKLVYDEESKTVDYRKKRVTDMSTNKRISAPKAAPVEQEMKIQMLVQSLENIVKKAGERQEKFPRAGTSTLSHKALEGRKSLLQRKKIWRIGYSRS